MGALKGKPGCFVLIVLRWREREEVEETTLLRLLCCSLPPELPSPAQPPKHPLWRLVEEGRNFEVAAAGATS